MVSHFSTKPLLYQQWYVILVQNHSCINHGKSF